MAGELIQTLCRLNREYLLNFGAVLKAAGPTISRRHAPLQESREEDDYARGVCVLLHPRSEVGREVFNTCWFIINHVIGVLWNFWPI